MFTDFHKARSGKGFTLTELAIIFIIIGLFVVLLAPYIKKIRRRTKLIACEENLQKISLGLKLYANDHQGKLPASLGTLLDGGYIEDVRTLDCPNSGNIGSIEEPDYHYTTGYTILSPSESVIVFDKFGNHTGGRHVLYVSGKIEWEPQK